METAKPPSPQTSTHSRLFRIGKDSYGHWVVQDQQGLRGGLFVGKAEALKFAMSENGNRPQAVIMVPGILELNVNNTPRAARPITSYPPIRLQRVA
jgi:hypothetical protein